MASRAWLSSYSSYALAAAAAGGMAMEFQKSDPSSLHSHSQKQQQQAKGREFSLRFDRIGHEMNKATKWAASGSTAAVVLWRHDDAVMWAITGAVVNAANSKLLKRLINQQRPATVAEVNLEPGMPSTHAQSLAYLGTYAAFGIFEWSGVSLTSLFLAFAILLCASYMARLRVSEGLHTPAQVIVGATLGCASASIWLWMWLAFVQNLTLSFTWARALLFVSFLSSAIGFIVYALAKWFHQH
ncbi:hypothetical protein O6H91_14G064000 [Diphasiastrum complanatum]|uniref:Uncharacterized protein n=1 Tax=Diphasiastrum complanatum TaxID=34168 RepID=A0ACC2BQ52_DIPCM|nr:hypothetical protein O6H91_14G064000 [Diphasiastrum complanatum]